MDLPHWPNVSLGEVLAERREVPDAAKVALGEIPIVAKIAFDTGQLSLREGTDTKTRMILIRRGDLVVSGINAYKGAIAILEGLHLFAAATIHYGAYSIRDDRVFPRFLWWLLRSNAFRELLRAYVPGGIKTELKAKRLLPIPIPLPPLAQQRRIVARIEELAAKIEEARRLREVATHQAAALRNCLAREAFDCEGASIPLENLCVAIIDNLHTNPVYSQSGVPCIRSPDVGWGELFLAGARRTDEKEYKHRTVRGEPTTDDIVLVREGGGTGKAALVREGERFSLGQRVMMLRPDRTKILPKFLLFQILSPQIYRERVLAACTGSASPHLNIGDLRRFEFVVPSMDQQRRVVWHLESTRAWVDRLQRKQETTTAELDALLASILDKAFKGEL